jgi:hypothetical protein
MIMADNINVGRPLDSEELSVEKVEKVSGGAGSENGSDQSAGFNISFINTSGFNMTNLN